MTAPGADWRGRYSTLRALPADSDPAVRRRRGREFERVLHEMLAEARMWPRSSYRPAGEEIDGSFVHYGRTLLMEAKWTGGPVAASTLYQFRGKLEGKLAGTLGVFISMGGYSDDAVDALVAGKSVNMILFDQRDMDKIAQPGCIGIRRALTLKLRAAAESGTPYFPLPPCTPREPGEKTPGQVVVVEGPSDADIMRALLQSRWRGLDPPPPPRIVIAGGLQNLPLLAVALAVEYQGAGRIIIVVDGDDRPAQVRQQIQAKLSEVGAEPGAPILTLVVDAADLLALAQSSEPPAAPPGSDLRRLAEALGLLR
jgi:5S rRNA maturation endonuclease (ribonuclease M5)